MLSIVLVDETIHNLNDYAKILTYLQIIVSLLLDRIPSVPFAVLISQLILLRVSMSITQYISYDYHVTYLCLSGFT